MMRKRHYIILAIVAVALLVCAAVVLRPRQLPLEECSQLYRDYADNPHVTVAFIKDFPVNDTLRVDVTTLQATTDSAWVALMVDFGAPKEFIDMYNSDRDFFERDKVNSLTIFYIDKKCIHKRKSKYDPDSWLVIGSFTAKTFCVFMTDDIYFKNQIGLTEFNKLEK